MTSDGKYAAGQHPVLPPPVTTVGVIGWVRTNLFSSYVNVGLTALAAYLIYISIPPLINWAFIDAIWVGDSPGVCRNEEGGPVDVACWVYIRVWFKFIMYGRYPDQELWRINLAYVIVVGAMVPLFIPRFRWKHWIAVFLLIGFPPIALYLFSGLSRVTIEAWPYRLMAFSAIAVGVLALLPLLNVWRERSAAISLALLILVPLWGLSAPSTWTTGLLYGTPGWAGVAAVVLAVAPALALAVGATLPRWRALIAGRLPQLCVAASVVAMVGFAVPLMAWEETAGSSPPLMMVLTAAMLALAVLCPWGYGAEAGLPGRLARLLLPFYMVFVYLVMAGPPDFLNFGALDWTPNVKPFFTGVGSVLPFVETPLWGGMFLTLVIAVTGIVASLPIGVVLALGRRSDMPIVKAICIGFIEFWRGIPLITVLFMSSVMFPLFMPEGMTFDKLIRALIGVMLFSSAYMAEVIRGGLQAIPRGQYEAAQALGLSFWKMMGLIVLPQALKLVIPGIVNTFIGLFKDTTLVLIIGLFDLLGAVQATFTNPKWGGFHITGYVFAAFIFWIFCFSMSQYSQRLEKKLHTGH